MKSIRLQLLITLLATAVVAGVFAIRGLPPTASILRGASRKDVEAVRRCIRWGADIEAKNSSGRTPLHVTRGKDITALLIDRGADVNAKDKNGWTPLHCAAREGHRDKAALLIVNGADVSARSNQMWTPLHWAAKHGHTRHRRVAVLLIARGADVEAKNNRGMTPLHMAASPLYHSGQMTALLIAKGADVNAKDNDGRTPLTRAIKNGHNDVADLLRRHGARE